MRDAACVNQCGQADAVNSDEERCKPPPNVAIIRIAGNGCSLFQGFAEAKDSVSNLVTW